MSYSYASIAATAQRLIEQFGQSCTLTRTIRDGATTTQTGVAVNVNLNEGDRQRIGEVQIPARKFYIDGSVTPKAGDILTVGAESFRVQYQDPIKPAATVLAWVVLAVAK